MGLDVAKPITGASSGFQPKQGKNTKGEKELVLCMGIWYGNLQFCPKWLSEISTIQKFDA